MIAPTSFRAGDSVAWVEPLPATPAPDWTLTYRLLWPSGTAVDISATPSGADHAVSLDAAATQNWTPGAATLLSWVTRGAERITLAQTSVVILPNLATATTFDGRSQAVKALADARAALAAYVASGKVHVAEYDIAGRRMKFRSSQEIRDLIAHYETEVVQERALTALLTGHSPGRVLTRF